MSYYNFNHKVFHQALIDYVDARYKPIEIPREHDEEFWLDIRKAEDETAWNLENNEEIEIGELNQFIQDLLNTFVIKETRQVWVLDERC